MSARKFKVGDKIVVTGIQSGNSQIVGRKGVVVHVDPPYFADQLCLAVRFFRRINRGHDCCSGDVKYGYGFWLFPENVKLIKGVVKKQRCPA